MNIKRIVYMLGCGLLIGIPSYAQVPQIINYQGRIAVNGTNFTGNGQFKLALVDGGTNNAHAATGIATISGGFLTIVNVTDGGLGYVTAPTVTAIGGGGSGAVLTANVSNGSVTSVTVNNPGGGYTSIPAIVFSSPPPAPTFKTFWSNDGTSTNGGEPTSSVRLPVTKGLYSVLLGDTSISNMAPIPAAAFTNNDVRIRTWFNDGITGFQQLTPDQRLAAVGYAIMAGTVPDGSITSGKIAPGAVGSSQLAQNLTIPGTLTVSNLVISGSAVTGSTNYLIPSNANFQSYAGASYYITNSSATFTLPTIANIGDTVHIVAPNANGAGSGIFTISQNPGQRIVGWRNISGNPEVGSSSDGSHLLVGGSQGFYLSTNSGVDWTTQPQLLPFATPDVFSPFQISADGSHIFAGAIHYTPRYSGIIASTDYGNTWAINTNFPGDDSITSIACSSNGVKVVAVSQAIFTSTNAGSNWVLQSSAPNANWQCVASSADGTKLVAAVYSGGIYTSTNSGQTWTPSTGAPSNAGWFSVASSTDGTKLVAAIYNGGIYTSTNSGQTWTLSGAPTGRGWHSVASSADGTKLVAANVGDPAIFTSVDSGLTWAPEINGLVAGGSGYFVASSSDGLKLIAYDSGFYTSTDSGNTWSSCSTLPNGQAVLVSLTSVGALGGATFSSLPNYGLTLVYLGSGMFVVDQANIDNLHGY